MRTNNRILTIAAHPDDEILMAGGTMANAVEQGIDVAVLILADGCTSRMVLAEAGAIELGLIDEKQRAACAANITLGVRDVFFERYPDNRMDSVPRLQVARTIEHYIGMWKPSTVITHHGSDVNVDHRIVNDAVIVACRPQPGCTVNRLLFGEVPSSTESQPVGRTPFQPNFWCGIEGTIAKKMQALKCYAGEMRGWPHARSYDAVESLARWRGASVGIKAAEAFVLAREIRSEKEAA